MSIFDCWCWKPLVGTEDTPAVVPPLLTPDGIGALPAPPQLAGFPDESKCERGGNGGSGAMVGMLDDVVRPVEGADKL